MCKGPGKSASSPPTANPIAVWAISGELTSPAYNTFQVMDSTLLEVRRPLFTVISDISKIAHLACVSFLWSKYF